MSGIGMVLSIVMGYYLDSGWFMVWFLFSLAIGNMMGEHSTTRSHEEWDKDLFIQSKVVSFNSDFVECDCLMDKDYLETMCFPRNVFDKIENLDSKPYLVLNIRSKSGSIRIDVKNDDKSIDKNIFEKYQCKNPMRQ